MSGQESISYQLMLDWVNALAPFSMAFVTDDQGRDTGGEWIEIKEGRKHNALTQKEKAQMAKAQPEVHGCKKNPKHYKNGTLNIVLPNGEIRKASLRLIRRIGPPGLDNLFENGKTVM